MSGNSSGIPPSPPPVAILTSAPAGGVVTVPAAPPALAILSRGATVEAQVTGPGEGGMTVLSAVIDGETVEVAARLPAVLPPGAELILKVTQPGESATLRLTAVGSRASAPVSAEAVLAERAAEAPTAEPGGGVAFASTIGVGRPVPALVLQGDVMQDATAQGRAEPLLPGTRLVVRLTQFTLPDASLRGPAGGTAGAAPGAGGNPSAPPPQAAVGEAAARYAAIGRFAAAASPLPGPPALVANAFAPVSAVAASPPQTPPAVPGGIPSLSGAAPHVVPSAAPSVVSAAPSAPSVPGGPVPSAPSAGPEAARPGAVPSASAMPGSLSGVVISRSALGQPTVHTPAGFIALDVRAPLPNGTQVSLDILSRLPPEAGAMPPPAAALGAASPWTTLEALWQSLAEADPGAAARLVAALPQAGPQLLANLTAAMAAVRGGDASVWLGLPEIAQRAQTREEARVAKLAQRFSDDIKGAARAANRPEGEWRVYPLPFVAGGQVERIQMLVRRAPDADDAEEGGRRGRRKDTRFILDLTLSRLGEMQIDGLVNPPARNLDLVIRTRQDLPAPMPADLRGLFAEALLAVGYAGNLAFRVTQDFVVPVAEVEDAPDRPGVVV
jgi:hypothetical protein